jgi:hypothetical protein
VQVVLGKVKVMESEHSEHQVPIWFFVGFLLLVYGVLIFGAGIYALWVPTDVQKKLLESWNDAPWFFLHPDVWWGGFMAIIGLIYCIRFNPLRPGETITGRAE